MTVPKSNRPKLIITTNRTGRDVDPLLRLSQYYTVQRVQRSGFFDAGPVVALVFTGTFSYFLGKGLDLLLDGLKQMLQSKTKQMSHQEQPLTVEINILVEEVSASASLHFLVPIDDRSFQERVLQLESLREIKDPCDHAAYVETGTDNNRTESDN